MAGRLPPQASSLPWFSNGLTNWTGTGTLGILSTMFLVGWTSAMRFSQPRSSYDSSATRCRPGCRQFSRQGSTPSVSEWMPRTPPTSRAPSTSTSPMGRAGAVLVADAMASHPGGRLAGAEHAVRLRLLRHRRLAAVGWRPRGAIRVGSGGVTHGRLYRYPQSHAHCDSLRRDDERAWELRRDHSSVGHRPRMP